MIDGTVIAPRGVNVRNAPNGPEKVGRPLERGTRVEVTCQTEKDGLPWLKLKEPRSGNWIVRSVGRVTPVTVVQLESEPPRCSDD